MDNIIWKAITKKGQMICQQEQGKYNNFLDYDHQQWICFTLFNKTNNLNYGIDLIRGCFLFNGVAVHPSIQNNIYDVPCIPKQRFNYGKTLFWYNQFLSQLNTNTTENKCINVFIGYTVQLDSNITINKRDGIIKLARPCLKLNTITNMVSFSTSYVFQYVDQQGNKIKVQG